MVEVHLARGVVRMPANHSIKSHDWIRLQDERGIAALGDLCWIVETVTMVQRHLDLLVYVLCLQIPVVVLLERLDFLHGLLNLSVLLFDVIRIESALLTGGIGLVMLCVFRRGLHLPSTFLTNLPGFGKVRILLVESDRFLGLGIGQGGQPSLQFGASFGRCDAGLLRCRTGFLRSRCRPSNLARTLLSLLLRILTELHLFHGLIKLLLRFFLRELHPIVLRKPRLILRNLELHVLVQAVHLISYVGRVNAPHINRRANLQRSQKE